MLLFSPLLAKGWFRHGQQFSRVEMTYLLLNNLVRKKCPDSTVEVWNSYEIYKQKHRAILNKAIGNISRFLLQEIEQEIADDRKRIWVKKWISRIDSLGASSCLLRELEYEDQGE